jgi:Zn-dependent M32 family carboxypeptidase
MSNNIVKKKKDSALEVIDAAVVADMPVELSENLTLLSRKIYAYLSYFSAASLSRLANLNKFISEAEDRLYNVDVQKLDMKELNARYKEAKKAQAEIMTICSQVSKQAVETENTARIDTVYNLLKNMSAETLQQLQEALAEPDDDDTSEE